MPKRIPIARAKAVAQDCDLRQVILVGWDGERTHVVTYGGTTDDCAQAALGGNLIKKALGWPDNLWSEPTRVKQLQARITQLEAEVRALKDATHGT